MQTESSPTTKPGNGTCQAMRRIPDGTTTETTSERLGLISDEAYAIGNTLSIVEAAIDSDQAAALIERKTVQAALFSLGERIVLVGEELERLQQEVEAAERPVT